MMAKGKRFLLYSQHLSGTGHFVRTFEIARALAEDNEVYLVDGGRPVPRQEPNIPFKKIALPPIYRSNEGIASVDLARDIDGVMKERRKLLLEFVGRVRPETILIEHFPFSKWLLYSEIIPMIELARERTAPVKVICSIRDILPITRRDPHPTQHRLNVLGTLHKYFDAILVHADPKIVRLEEHIPWVGEITLPILYTGYVSEKPSSRKDDPNGPACPSTNEGNFAIVSGGGAGGVSLISHCINAWNHPDLNDVSSDQTLVVFPPLFLPNDTFRQLEQQTGNGNIKLKSFTSRFVDWMEAANFSISQAGYNTCTNILETHARAILIPDTEMSDQLARARRLSEHGIGTVIDPAELNTGKLVKTIRDTLGRPRPEHNIALNGAQNTRKILEKFCHV